MNIDVWKTLRSYINPPVKYENQQYYKSILESDKVSNTEGFHI